MWAGNDAFLVGAGQLVLSPAVTWGWGQSPDPGGKIEDQSGRMGSMLTRGCLPWASGQPLALAEPHFPMKWDVPGGDFSSVSLGLSCGCLPGRAHPRLCWVPPPHSLVSLVPTLPDTNLELSGSHRSLGRHQSPLLGRGQGWEQEARPWGVLALEQSLLGVGGGGAAAAGTVCAPSAPASSFPFPLRSLSGCPG